MKIPYTQKNTSKFSLKLYFLFSLFSISPFLLFAQSAVQKMVKKESVAFSKISASTPFSKSSNEIEKVNNAIKGNKEYLNLDLSFNQEIIKNKKELVKITIPSSGSTPYTLDLKRINVLTESFILTAASSGDKPLASDLGVFYWGVVEGYENSTAAINIFKNEISGTINVGENSYTLGKVNNSNSYVLYQEKDLAEKPTLSCFTDKLEANIKQKVEEQQQMIVPNPDNCVRMYVEIDNDLYAQFGNVTATYNYFAGAFSQVAILYANESINMTLNQVLVWDTEDPYTGPGTSGYLDQFTAALNGSFNGDLAHLVGNQGGGGLAYVNVLCGNNNRTAYSSINTSYQDVPSYSWTVNVLAHEIGHNLGSPHTHSCSWNGNDTQIDDCGNQYIANGGGTPGACYDSTNIIIPQGGGTIMSYCHLNSVGMDFNLGFGPQPGDLIRNNVYNASCLSACPECTEFGNPCDDNDPCTINDAIDSYCNCVGVPTYDNDQDGLCGQLDPDDDDFCNPIPCTNCTMTNIIITFDQYPGETSWEITDSTGSVLFSGAGYSEAYATDTISICMADGCYDFTINDQYSDGICCGYGNGSYMVTDDIGNVIISGNGEFGATETTNFCYNNFATSCTAGTACDDGDACTINDVEDAACNCAGTFADNDNDGVCDANDICPGGDDALDSDNDGTPDFCDSCDGNLAGQTCNDSNPCTINDMYDANCNCAGTFSDTDSDGVCDANDICPGGDDNIDIDNDSIPDFCDDCSILPGTPCDDANVCTTDDVYDTNCNCVGTFADADNDGVCDANDICPGGNDNLDGDNDGTPDFCDTCDGSLTGQTCDDANICTTNDVYDSNCNCTGTLTDTDNDGVCDALDICPGGDDNMDIDNDSIPDFCDDCSILPGTPCDDANVCTTDDVYDANCNCAGTFADADNDGVCDANDICPGGDDNMDADNDNIPDFCDYCSILPGTPCDDANVCTTDDVYDANCNCVGTIADTDNDGVCDALDICPGGDDTMDADNDSIPDFCDDCDGSQSPATCDDGDICTVNDVLDFDCNCAGTLADMDNDGVCDALDICPGGDDNMDADNDSIPDFCDDCSILPGTPCDDANVCTTDDVYDANCNCAGTLADTDNDGVCDALDICPGGDDTMDADNDSIPDFCDDCSILPGTPCDDANVCTTDDVYDANCNCAGTIADMDNDGVCDALDICLGGDDTLDSDNDGTPDFCENDCSIYFTSFSDEILSHNGIGESSITLTLPEMSQDIQFTITGLDAKTNGNINNRFSDKVKVDYIDESGTIVEFGIYSGEDISTADINISPIVKSIIISLSDGYDGEANATLSINLSEIEFCGPVCADNDMDGVCDIDDICPGSDDAIDSDMDGVPDGCDDCSNSYTPFPNPTLLHEGAGGTMTSVYLYGQKDPSFIISGLDAKINGNPNQRYIDLVKVSYTDALGNDHEYNTYSGEDQESAEITLFGAIQSITITLVDGYDGTSPKIAVELSQVTGCAADLVIQGNTQTTIEKTDSQTEILIYPNPSFGDFTIVFDTKEKEAYKVTIQNLISYVNFERTIYGEGAETAISVNTSDWPAGIYYITLSNKNQKITTKSIAIIKD